MYLSSQLVRNTTRYLKLLLVTKLEKAFNLLLEYDHGLQFGDAESHLANCPVRAGGLGLMGPAGPYHPQKSKGMILWPPYCWSYVMQLNFYIITYHYSLLVFIWIHAKRLSITKKAQKRLEPWRIDLFVKCLGHTY